MRAGGVGLGQLLLALDTTMARLVEAPRGLDLAVASAALIDSDDVRLGLGRGSDSADVFFLLGVSDTEAQRWLESSSPGPAAVAVFAKQPSDALVAKAVAGGTAVVSVDPRARWERLYRLVDHVLQHHGDARHDSGTDLFGLAQSLADRIHGMVSIEDEQSHVLAYSASNDEADELRRLSILGRAGPPEHLRWIGQWGIFDALRAGGEVVRVAERPELGLQPRLAVGIHRADGRRSFVGCIWVQQGSRPLADDAEEVLRGAAVLAARVMSRLTARPSTHALRVQQLLGLSDGGPIDVGAIASELGVATDGQAVLVAFDQSNSQGRHDRLADVLALSANAFRPDAQVAARGSRVYVLFPQTAKRSSLQSWIRGTIGGLDTELGLQLRAVIAAPLAGLAGLPTVRADVDRVLDSVARHPDSFDAVTALADARSTVLLDEIVTMVAADERLVDPRVRELQARDPVLAQTLRVYLDEFGDVAAAAQQLHVHPNTVRYRIRRIETILTTSLADPDVRLLLSLGLRAGERIS